MKHVILLVLLLSYNSFVYAADKPGAKALFYSGEGTSISTAGKKEKTSGAREDTVIPKEKFTGIAYWIDLLDRDGRRTRTTANQQFRSGDRIKLNFKSNRDGYLYVLNYGTTGTSRVMFPNAGQINNIVAANQEYAVPERSYMKFDENPGVETLLVLLSPQPIPELAPSSPDMNVNETRKLLAYADTHGAKDLLLEDDIDPAKSLASQYVVAPASSLGNGKVISLYIKLRHGR